MARTLLQRMFPRDGNHMAGLHEEVARAAPFAGRALDLGCGANTDLATLRSDSREVWGTDFESHSHLHFPEWFRPLNPDATAPFPDSHFDLIASIMVLEHVRDPQAFLREVARLLRPGGAFIGHTISGSHYVTWLRRMMGLMPHAVNQSLVRRLYGRAEEDTFPAFYLMNTERRVRRACRGTGLELAHVRRYADPGYFRFTALTESLAVLADRALAGVLSSWGRLYVTFVLRKTTTAS